MIGWTLAHTSRTDSKVLLIRCTWGGKSVSRQFKPPCGRPFDSAGRLYKALIPNLQTALGNLTQIPPNDFYDPRYDEAKVAGFFGITAGMIYIMKMPYPMKELEMSHTRHT
jgi:hypothetical protein